MARKSRAAGFAEPRSRYGAPRTGGLEARAVALGKRGLPAPETLPDGTVRYFLILGPKGRVLLPADMRAALAIEEGDVITAWLKEGEVRLHSHLHGLRKIQVEASSRAAAGIYASDELIAERRAEVAREDEETLRELRAHKKKRR